MDGSTSVLTIAVGLYVGMSLSQFFTAITKDLITPIIAGIFPGVQSSVDKFVVQIGPIKLSVGDAISATLNLLIAWFVVSTTLPYIRTYAPIGGRR
jgi:large-conductance mechanosensitive channel